MTKWGSIKYEVPNEMEYETKGGKTRTAAPITKTGAIATRNGEKAIRLIYKRPEHREGFGSNHISHKKEVHDKEIKHEGQKWIKNERFPDNKINDNNKKIEETKKEQKIQKNLNFSFLTPNSV